MSIEKEPQFDNKEEKVEEKKEEVKVDPDKIAIDFAENLRSEIEKMKVEKADPHLEYIDTNTLTYEDLVVFNKAKNRELKENEFMSYTDKLKQFFKENDCQKKTAAIKELRRKFDVKEITKDEFKEAYKEIFRQADLERGNVIDGKYVSAAKCDSRANFAAMIRHWMVYSGEV